MCGGLVIWSGRSEADWCCFFDVCDVCDVLDGCGFCFKVAGSLVHALRRPLASWPASPVPSLETSSPSAIQERMVVCCRTGFYVPVRRGVLCGQHYPCPFNCNATMQDKGKKRGNLK